MAERKQVVHYCVKCGKGMKYKEKKMCYMYDVISEKFLDFERERTKKRFAINLCEKCADELQKMIEEWRESEVNNEQNI